MDFHLLGEDGQQTDSIVTRKGGEKIYYIFMRWPFKENPNRSEGGGPLYSIRGREASPRDACLLQRE